VIPRRLHGADQVLDRRALGIECDRRVLAGEIDRRADAVELVQPLLDPHRARRARHTLQLELNSLARLLDGGRHHSTS
jgi:hypothetical protein